MTKLISILLFFTVNISFTTQAVDIYLADKLFAEQKYSEAFVEYQKSAEIGNPYAHFRLGDMYAKGLGVEKDNTNSLLHFYLAAELKHQPAKEIFDNILNSYAKNQQENIIVLLNNRIDERGGKSKYEAYYPRFVTLNTVADEHAERVYPFTRKNLVPKYIWQSDVYPDGSRRNEMIIFSFLNLGVKDNSSNKPFSIFPKSKTIENKEKVTHKLNERALVTSYIKPSFFIHGRRGSRVSEVDFREQVIIKQNWQKLKIKASPTKTEQFQLAMMIIHHKWMFTGVDGTFDNEEKQKEYHILHNESLKTLAMLAEQKFPQAMFELGCRNFSDKYFADKIPASEINKKQLGLSYIANAARYNYAPAEFRLGMIFTSSPWAEKDEQKALFWFQSAAEKNLQPAILRLAELLLTADNQALHDRTKALEWLEKYNEKSNPEYLYLLALTYKNQAKPNWREFFDNLLSAIFSGSRLGWDVSEWQALYDKYIKGNITIEDDEV